MIPHPATEGHPLNLLFREEELVFFLFQNLGPGKVFLRSDQDQDRGLALAPKHQMWVKKQRGTEVLGLGH